MDYVLVAFSCYEHGNRAVSEALEDLGRLNTAKVSVDVVVSEVSKLTDPWGKVVMALVSKGIVKSPLILVNGVIVDDLKRLVAKSQASEPFSCDGLVEDVFSAADADSAIGFRGKSSDMKVTRKEVFRIPCPPETHSMLTDPLPVVSAASESSSPVGEFFWGIGYSGSERAVERRQNFRDDAPDNSETFAFDIDSGDLVSKNGKRVRGEPAKEKFTGTVTYSSGTVSEREQFCIPKGPPPDKSEYFAFDADPDTPEEAPCGHEYSFSA